MHEFIHLVLHTLKDTLNLLPFLLIAFLIIELIEHKLTNKTKKIIEKSGKLGPLLGSSLGMIPQCGFSVLATNLYITRIISLGTLIAVYLSTSDEMLPILLSRNAKISVILSLLFTKFIIGMISGFIIDFILRNKEDKHTEDYTICDDEHCHCDEENILISSLKHTLKTFIFIFIITFVLNFIMDEFGNEFIEKLFMKNNVFAPFISSLIGLIPNCGASVILTELYLSNVISYSSVISGLLTGSGVAILVLFRNNKNMKENLLVLTLVYFIGAFSGVIINLLFSFI